MGGLPVMMSIPSGGGCGVGWLVMDEYSFGGGGGKRLACDG